MPESNIPDRNGWGRSELHVMKELERLADEIAALTLVVSNLRVNVERKSAVWGAISGAVVGIIGLVIRR